MDSVSWLGAHEATRIYAMPTIRVRVRSGLLYYRDERGGCGAEGLDG